MSFSSFVTCVLFNENHHCFFLIHSTDPYKTEGDQHHEKIIYSCQAIQGHSGSPLFKNGKLVAVHIAADKNWRDGVSTNTVLHSLREHLELGTVS